MEQIRTESIPTQQESNTDDAGADLTDGDFKIGGDEVIVAKNNVSSEKDVEKSNHFDGNRKRATFPELLHEVLKKPEAQDVIQWTPDGNCFQIFCPRRFTKEILPTYFRQTQFPSFVRKLNRWGWRQLSKGRREMVYQHKVRNSEISSIEISLTDFCLLLAF